mmetsp:Transcript_34859/g.81455  ORF Transcript_34859/g.81455 Transcript_34859/m.81455 type:complete len:419 (+) Transcript_34859:77-1333(+)
MALLKQQLLLVAIAVAAEFQSAAAADEVFSEVVSLQAELDREHLRAEQASKRASQLQQEVSKLQAQLEAKQPVTVALQWLETCDFQLSFAGLGLLLGLASIWRPVHFVRGCACCLAAVAAGLEAAQLASSTWDGEFQDIFAGVAGLEAAIMASVAVAWGFQGFQLLIGALVGLCVALATMPQTDSESAGTIPASFAWAMMFTCAGFATMLAARTAACAALGPISGGFFAANSVGYIFTSLLFSAAHPTGEVSMPTWLQLPSAVISGHLSNGEALLGKKGGAELQLLRGVCLLTWALVAALGARVYMNGGIASSNAGEEGGAADLSAARQPLLEEGRGYHNLDGSSASTSASSRDLASSFAPRNQLLDYRLPRRNLTVPTFLKSITAQQIEPERQVPKMPKVPKKMGGRRSKDPYNFYA